MEAWLIPSASVAGRYCCHPQGNSTSITKGVFRGDADLIASRPPYIVSLEKMALSQKEMQKSSYVASWKA